MTISQTNMYEYGHEQVLFYYFFFFISRLITMQYDLQIDVVFFINKQNFIYVNNLLVLFKFYSDVTWTNGGQVSQFTFVYILLYIPTFHCRVIFD